MFNPATHQVSYRHRRFGLTEVLLVAAILVFGGFTLVNEGHQTFGSLLSGVGHVIGG